MKILYFFILILLPLMSEAQAHLGESFSGLESRYPDLTFEVETTMTEPYIPPHSSYLVLLFIILTVKLVLRIYVFKSQMTYKP